MRVVKYNYTNVAYCDNCGRIEFNPYFFDFSALFGVRSKKKFCALCASHFIVKYGLKVEVKQYE